MTDTDSSAAQGAQLSSILRDALARLRFEPTAKRIRAFVGGEVIADSTRAMLVWEPRRIVPDYAVPSEDIRMRVSDAQDATSYPLGEYAHRPMLDPGVPFDVHTCDGTSARVDTDGSERAVAAFLPADPALDGYVVLAFDDVDTWLEEDDEIIGHPHDPFHRIDVRSSSRHIRFELDGEAIAETTRGTLLFETHLPVRYYVPMEDMLVPLERTETTSICAYKGVATYYSATVGDQRIDDLAWQYEHPLIDGFEVKDLLGFFDERLDLLVDGMRIERPSRG